jgi:hypothetical protein
VELWLRDLGVDEAGNSVASLPSPAPAVTPRANAKRGTKPDTKQSTQRTSKPTAMPARGDSSTPPVDATLLDMERWLKLFPPSEAAKRGG